jgi:hypothetical protein
MTKSWILLGGLVLALGAAIAWAHHGPIEVVIDAAQDKKPPVTFSHAKHTEVVDSCVTCHHTQDGLTAGQETQVQLCAQCHLDPTEEGMPSMREMSLKKNPFHILCIDCHKEREKGPTKCAECHQAA